MEGDYNHRPQWGSPEIIDWTCYNQNCSTRQPYVQQYYPAQYYMQVPSAYDPPIVTSPQYGPSLYPSQLSYCAPAYTPCYPMKCRPEWPRPICWPGEEF